MLKITPLDLPDAPTLRIEGRITAQWIEALERACAAWCSGPGQLDLAGVTYLDEEGASALRRLEAAGFTVTGASALAREYLKTPADGAPTAERGHSARDGGTPAAGEHETDAGNLDATVRAFGGAMLATARRLAGCETAARRIVQAAFHAWAEDGGQLSAVELPARLERLVLQATISELRSRPAPPTEGIEQLLPRFDAGGRWAVQRPAWPAQDEPDQRRNDRAARVRACIERIPTEYRLVLLLRDGEQLDIKQTAELLTVPEEHVETRLHRARMALCELLIRESIDARRS